MAELLFKARMAIGFVSSNSPPHLDDKKSVWRGELEDAEVAGHPFITLGSPSIRRVDSVLIAVTEQCPRIQGSPGGDRTTLG